MKKHQIRAIVFAMAVALSACAKAIAQQPDFLFDRQFPFEWEYAATHSLELRNDWGETVGYLVAGSDLLMVGYSTREGRLSREVTHPARVFKLSPEGELLGEMAMNEEGRGSSILKLYRDPNDPKYCLALGRIMDSTLSYAKIFLAKFDLNLNLAWLREIDLPEEYRDLLGGRSLMDSQGDIVFCSWPFDGATMWSHLLYVRLSPEGELEAMAESSFRSWMPEMAQGGMFEFKDGSGDYGQTIVNDNNGSDSDYLLVRMDRDFTVFSPNDLESHIHMTETDGIIINQYYSESFGASMADGSKMVASRGIRYDGWNPGLWDEVIVSMKLDQNDSIVAFSYIPHDNDSVRALAFCQGMDESDGEAFFLCNGVYDRVANWRNWRAKPFCGDQDGREREHHLESVLRCRRARVPAMLGSGDKRRRLLGDGALLDHRPNRRESLCRQVLLRRFAIRPRSRSIRPPLRLLPEPCKRPAPPAILARREARANRALRPARPPRAQPRLEPRVPQPARPRPGAIRDEGHHGGRHDVLGQGGEGMITTRPTTMKDLFAKRASAIERGLQIPILDTSELQIRWNGDYV